jgi:hypothetical protein
MPMVDSALDVSMDGLLLESTKLGLLSYQLF